MINVAASCVFDNYWFIDFNITFIVLDVIYLTDTVAHMNLAVVHVVGLCLAENFCYFYRQRYC